MNKYKRIVLIGFRGAGKSTLGKILAQRLDWSYISTDEMVEMRTEKSIAEIVKHSGWKKFRDAEHEVIRLVSKLTNTIIDCGGGVVENPSNMRFFKSDSLIVWIDADLADIINRISADHNIRPLLTQNDFQSDSEKNYLNRRPLYDKYSDLRFSSSESTAEVICQLILKKLNQES